jgi:hypothetical protein
MIAQSFAIIYMDITYYLTFLERSVIFLTHVLQKKKSTAAAFSSIVSSFIPEVRKREKRSKAQS